MKFATRISLILIILVVALPVLGADPEPQLPQAASETPTPNSGINEVNPAENFQNSEKQLDELGATSPMMSEIRVAMELSRGEILEMSAQAAASNDFSARQEIQAEISALKKQTELDILAIQARYAVAAGNTELANQINNAIEAITSPPAPAAPAEVRPAPANQN